MTPATLTLHYEQTPQREPQAWYLAGDDPAVWLREIASWPVDHRALRCYPLPRSLADRQPRGVLVTGATGDRLRPGPRCLAFGVAGEQLYLPVEASLLPAVTDRELSQLLTPGNVYVWHPPSGLIAFEPHEALSLVDLVQVPRRRERPWDAAQLGVSLAKRLTAISPSQNLTVEMILDAGRDDIGANQQQLDELPPSPLEPKTGIANAAGRQGTRALAGLVRWFTRLWPPGNSPMMERLEAWANRQLAGIRSGLDAARNKELLRLMHLLENDPDLGLRYALPIGGDAHRGQGAPGARLGLRNVDFRLGRPGSGGPADYWDVSGEHQYKLIARYRELANREIQLGRHRRAAYIYAELLSDHDAAANTLADGRHWREAATLYRRRLNRPLDAARCFEQGGLWNEAIALYEELQAYETAGDLYARLDQPDNAARLYRQAVTELRTCDDYLAAAKLLEQKLREPDEALNVLALGWPHTGQAQECLREIFRLHGRLGQHQATLDWIRQFRGEPSVIDRELTIVKVLAGAAAEYPDTAVRRDAGDCIRAIAARQLATAPQAASRQLLAAVSQLAPHDLLLGRDCHRYLQQRPAGRLPAPAAQSPSRRKHPRLVRTIMLPPAFTWKGAIWSGKTIYAAGVNERQLTVVRANWDGQVSETLPPWRLEVAFAENPLLLAVDPLSDRRLLTHVIGAPTLTSEKSFTQSDAIPDPMIAGAIPGLSPAAMAAVRTAQGFTWLLEWRNQRITLVGINANGHQVMTRTLPSTEIAPELLDAPVVVPLPLHARGMKVYVGFVNQLLSFSGSREFAPVEFDHPIYSLFGSFPNSRTRVGVTFETGGQVFWSDDPEKRSETFASEMSQPVACFNRGGYLIAACQESCEIYSSQGQSLQFAAELPMLRQRPLAVLPAPASQQFGIVYATGQIDVYEIP